jgi:hypothetical protein
MPRRSKHICERQVEKYAEMTNGMIKSRNRIENVPITLNVKGK